MAGERPDVDVLPECIPSDGGVLTSGLPEEPVIAEACCRWVVREQHGHQRLVLCKLQCERWVGIEA